MLQRNPCIEAEVAGDTGIGYRSKDSHRIDSEETSAAGADRSKGQLKIPMATKPDSSLQFAQGRFPKFVETLRRSM